MTVYKGERFMFEKNILNPFGDKGYKMKKSYNADKLVVANFGRISSTRTDFGPMIETTELKYIFEPIIDNKKNIKYREIFTGFIANVDEHTFDLPYVVIPTPFTDYFPETIGTKIPKLSLIWAQNDLNYTKKQDDVKQLKR